MRARLVIKFNVGWDERLVRVAEWTVYGLPLSLVHALRRGGGVTFGVLQFNKDPTIASF